MRVAIGILIGAVLGFTIGYFGKCASGTCPMTSNPIVSTLIGAVLGAVMTMDK